MPARSKYNYIITEIHNEWCRANGYPVRPCLNRKKPPTTTFLKNKLIQVLHKCDSNVAKM